MSGFAICFEDGNKNCVLWIMGPTASGKTTLANGLKTKFRENGILTLHYDGDEVRDFFGPEHGFKEKDRLMVVKTLAHLANKAVDAGVNVIVSALTANEDAREYVKKHVKNLVLVYLECSIEKCMERDPKGLYKKAVNSELDTVIGYNTEYLPLVGPDLVLNTEDKSAEEVLADFVQKLHLIRIQNRLSLYVGGLNW